MSVEEQLRRAFHAHAQRVQPSADALATIRTRIARRTHLARRITVGLASLSSAAVVTATVIIAGTVSCAPPSTTEPVPPAGPSSSVTTTPTTPAPPGADRVPIYYLGQVGSRIMLYREFRTVTPADGTLSARIAAAVQEMLRNDPLDPDYFGAWPDGATVREVRIEGDVAVVALTGALTNNVNVETARMTIEQLVWTVTAVAADAQSPLNGVRLVVDESSRANLWGHVEVSGVLRRGDSTQVQAPVWLISPQHGDTVGDGGPLPDVGDRAAGRPVPVHIDGTVFEATVALRVLDDSGTATIETYVTLDEGAPGRGEATTTLTLMPGRYTLQAFVYSMDDGSVQAMDDHEITVI
jgi:Sporulation and spore germination./Immunoglobulin-like domain of bacterial spore germination.